MRIFRVLLFTAISAAAWSQTLVEYGLGVAAAGTAGAGGGARGIAGVFSNLSKTLNSAGETGTAAAAATPAKTPAAKPKTGPAATQPAVAEVAPSPAAPKPVVVYEDPAGIQVGMEQTELVRRFGEPVAKITTGSDGESLTYAARDRVYEVEVRAGKVVSLQAKSRPRDTAVVLLQ